jgi:hypothetical protein
MKKPFLLILLIAALSLVTNAQVLYSWDFEDQAMGGWSAWSPATAAVVANPVPSGNASAYVLEYNQTAQGWKGVAHWQDPTILSADVKTISVDVYIVGASGLVQLYMDNSTSGAPNNSSKQVTGIPADTWATATFDVSDVAVLDYKQFAFQCDVKGMIYLDNIQVKGAEAVTAVKKVIARETFGTSNYDTNNPIPQASGWGSGTAWHFKWTDVTSLTSTNGHITAGSDSSLRIQSYNDVGAKPDDWREPSSTTVAHMAIRDGDAYKGSWDTLYYSSIDISSAYSVTAIEFGYARARTLSVDTTHRSLNVEYRVDGGEWMQLDTSLIIPGNVYKKWDYIVMPVNITGQVLDIRFACIQPNEQIYIDDITVEASVPTYELWEAVITRETFGSMNFDTNNPIPQTSGWGSGTAWHYKWTDITSLTSTNGYITSGSDSSLRIQSYNDVGAKPEDWREPSTPTVAHMAIRDGDAYKGSWDTLCFRDIDISSAFSVTAIEFGYARARTLSVDTTHRSLNVEYRVDGGEWMQLDTSLIIPANVYKKWDYIVMPVFIKGGILDIRFACIQPNEQIYIDDITVAGKVQAPEGVNDFVVEKVVFGAIDSPEDYTCDLNLKWDADNVYLKFVIADDSLVANGTTYQVDNIEIYFDMDNSKNIHWPRNGGWVSADPTYDKNDFQLRLVPEDEFSANNSLKGVTQVYTKTDIGNNFDLTIPWDSLMAGFEPAIGTQIGFDVLASDNDAVASDPNRNQVTLFSSTAYPYNDPSLFGTLQFEGMGTFKSIPDEEVPGVAKNLTATVVKDAVTLAWDNATDNIAILYYNVYQGSTLLSNKVYPKQTGNTLKISALADGDYTFSLETVDNSGNVSKSKASVKATVLTVSVKDLSSSKLAVYPNPTNSMLNIKGVDNVSRIEVIGMTGNIMKVHKGSSTISVAELSKGAYFLKVYTASEVLTTRFIKE